MRAADGEHVHWKLFHSRRAIQPPREQASKGLHVVGASMRNAGRGGESEHFLRRRRSAPSGFIERKEAMPDSPPTPDVSWRSIYILGAVSAVLTLGGTVFDIVLASIPGWQSTSTVPTSVVSWLVQFGAAPLLALRNLDLLNTVLAVVGLPMYVALYGVHRKTRAGLALLALVFVSVGTAVFVANNVALPMLELGRQYALASTEAQRLVIEGAGAAMLARGSHGSAGVFAGFLLPSLGTLLMAVTMVGGGVFRALYRNHWHGGGEPPPGLHRGHDVLARSVGCCHGYRGRRRRHDDRVVRPGGPHTLPDGCERAGLTTSRFWLRIRCSIARMMSLARLDADFLMVGGTAREPVTRRV